MKKLNTQQFYSLAQVISPLLALQHAEGMTTQTIFYQIARADMLLKGHISHKDSVFSGSLKRAAGSVTRAIHDLAGNDDIFEANMQQKIGKWQLDRVVEAAKNFETVLANELPGLATYVVSAKGIYSTDDLISQASVHIPESLRAALPEKATSDVNEAGKCLAFEVPTASAFHMWRAVESVMDDYYFSLTGKTFSDGKVSRNWGAYIKALNDAGADKKITVFLDHIREEYRNPVAHPTETVELEEAFGLFGVAISVISQMLRATIKLVKPVELNQLAAIAALVPKNGS